MAPGGATLVRADLFRALGRLQRHHRPVRRGPRPVVAGPRGRRPGGGGAGRPGSPPPGRAPGPAGRLDDPGQPAAGGPPDRRAPVPHPAHLLPLVHLAVDPPAGVVYMLGEAATRLLQGRPGDAAHTVGSFAREASPPRPAVAVPAAGAAPPAGRRPRDPPAADPGQRPVPGLPPGPGGRRARRVCRQRRWPTAGGRTTGARRLGAGRSTRRLPGGPGGADAPAGRRLAPAPDGAAGARRRGPAAGQRNWRVVGRRRRPAALLIFGSRSLFGHDLPPSPSCPTRRAGGRSCGGPGGRPGSAAGSGCRRRAARPWPCSVCSAPSCSARSGPSSTWWCSGRWSIGPLGRLPGGPLVGSRPGPARRHGRLRGRPAALQRPGQGPLGRPARLRGGALGARRRLSRLSGEIPLPGDPGRPDRGAGHRAGPAGGRHRRRGALLPLRGPDPRVGPAGRRRPDRAAPGAGCRCSAWRWAPRWWRCSCSCRGRPPSSATGGQPRGGCRSGRPGWAWARCFASTPARSVTVRSAGPSWSWPRLPLVDRPGLAAGLGGPAVGRRHRVLLVHLGRAPRLDPGPARRGEPGPRRGRPGRARRPSGRSPSNSTCRATGSGGGSWPPPLAGVALAVSSVPMVIASGQGRWHLPSADASSVLGLCSPDSRGGDYRVLWVGAPDALPLAARPLDAGIAYGTSYDGEPDVTDLWITRQQGATPALGADLGLVENRLTTKFGHLVAPMAVPLPGGPQPQRPGRIGRGRRWRRPTPSWPACSCRPTCRW